MTDARILREAPNFGGKLEISANAKQIPFDTTVCAQYLYSQVLPIFHEGFTVCPRRRVHLHKQQTRNFFVVSIRDFEQSFWPEPSLSELTDWLWRARHELFKAGRYVGAWRNGSCLVLDVSLLIYRRDRAQRLAFLEEQHSIFDLTDRDTIPVCSSPARKAA